MRKIFITIVLVLFCTVISFAQNVNIVRFGGIDANVADYVSELINKNI